MCAIVGIASTHSIQQKNWLSLAADILKHRGPNGAGEWWSSDSKVGFAHRRLSIIDLSPNGQQPMHSSSGELHIIFNGEIYNYLELKSELQSLNHSFKSESDTEVLLAAYLEWGEDCLDHLNGMFAFALFDARQAKLFLARDCAGEKPLYYWVRGGTISFASELKALMLDPDLDRSIDPEAFDCFLGLGFVPGDRSILSDIKKLPPAHSLCFNLVNGNFAISRYWSPPTLTTSSFTQGDQNLLSELESLLEQAVQRQLIADVPVGILLSGGVDSSIVAALAARNRTKIKTFTVRFPGGGLYDESVHAQRVATHFGTEHLTLDAEPSNVDLLMLLARQFDEPLNDSSMVPTFLVSQLIKQHCTVALGGDGADELFGGYTHYDRLVRLENSFGKLPRSFRNITAKMGGALLPIGFKGRNWAQALDVDFSNEVPLIAQYFDRNARLELLGISNGAAELHWAKKMLVNGNFVERAMQMDFENYLPEDILVKVDRASMLNSLEVRAPMLDKKVMEFAFGKVPSRLKVTSTDRKILLRRLAQKLLPPSFDATRKQGFSIPISSWLESGPWLSFFKEVLLDSSQTTFNRSFIEKLFKGQAAGRSNGERLFGLVMFELWRREYKIRI